MSTKKNALLPLKYQQLETKIKGHLSLPSTRLLFHLINKNTIKGK